MNEHPDEPPPPPPPLPTTSGTSSPITPVSRDLTCREREVLALMIDRGTCSDSDDRVKQADRARWRAQLATTRAGRPCGCGTCPSIELTDAAGVTPNLANSRVVLNAETDQAMLLLFIDDDQLSYLELAPTEERTFAEFPDPADIRTA